MGFISLVDLVVVCLATGKVLKSLMSDQQLDLSIYNKLRKRKCPRSTKSNSCIANCDYLERIAVGLKYYDLVCRNSIGKDKFVQFCQEIYKNVLDDYCHFISKHNHNLNEIKKIKIRLFIERM